MIPGSIKNVIYDKGSDIIYSTYMYKKMALHNLQSLICYKLKPNQTKPECFRADECQIFLVGQNSCFHVLKSIEKLHL